MILKDLIKGIENIAPLSLQEEWDNCGFQIKLHKDDDEISNILVCLEITTETIKEAISNDVQLIITHHPLFFSSFKQITIDIYSGEFVKELINHNISVYSSHTAFDICDGGNNDYFGKILNISNISKIDTDPDKISRFGDLEKTYTLNEFVLLMEKKFSIGKSFFNYSGPNDLKINRIAWVTGAGSDYMYYAKDVNADLFITGDLSYHEARNSKEINMPLLAIGHYASEMIFNNNMGQLIKTITNNNVNVICSNFDINPYTEI